MSKRKTSGSNKANKRKIQSSNLRGFLQYLLLFSAVLLIVQILWSLDFNSSTIFFVHDTLRKRLFKINRPSSTEGEEADLNLLPKCLTNHYEMIDPKKFTYIPLQNPLPWPEIKSRYPNVTSGSNRPRHCHNPENVAIIVPFRNRDAHLQLLMTNLHGLLQVQNVRYTVYLIEQIRNQTFNRAKLMNVGFMESQQQQQQTKFNCLIFHDVDLIPLDQAIPYRCDHIGPSHLSSAIDKFKFSIPYPTYFGGVTVFTKRQFRKMNGFSNEFWGWGGEDDDAAMRVKFSNQVVIRLPQSLGRYAMVRHGIDDRNSPNRERIVLLKNSYERWWISGLNDLDYQVLERKDGRFGLYRHFLVDLFESKNTGKLPIPPSQAAAYKSNFINNETKRTTGDNVLE